MYLTTKKSWLWSLSLWLLFFSSFLHSPFILGTTNTNANVENEFANLYRCCPPGFRYENSNCVIESETENGAAIADASESPKILELPEYLSMSAYNDKLRLLKFSLKYFPHPPMCSNGKFSLTISLKESNLTENPVNFTMEGYLKHGKDYYAPNEYCIDRLNDTEKSLLSIIVCNATCNSQNPCIKRCCEFGEVWDFTNVGKPGGKLTCQSSGEKQWHPVLYKDPYTLADSVEDSKILPHFISNHPRNGWCDPTNAIILPLNNKINNSKQILFRVLRDGTVVQKLRALTWEPKLQNVTCIDGAQNFPDDSHPTFFTGYPNDAILFDCKPTTKKQVSISDVYRIAMIISCVFLLLTVIVYALLWEKQNVHGWSLLCYITSLFFMYISLCLMHFSKELKFTEASNAGGGGGGLGCFIIGVSIHFFFLSSFCWLTVINFDLWWTFRTLKPTGGSKGLKRFLAYLVFALAVPVIIVSVALSLDLTYRDDINSDIIVPLYGRSRCYMDMHKPMLTYLYGPIGFLISLNIIFFVVTIYSMYKIQISTKFASNSSSRANKHNQSAKLFVKLFITMGVSWISEVISWAVSDDDKVAWYFVIFDMINILQAILIFIIFVCKKDTLNSLKQKYPKFNTLVSLITRKPEENNLSSSKSTRTELSFTDITATGDKIEMSSNPRQNLQLPT